jgi:trimethylamine:corrinoid methyltransferase-like protein
MLNRYLQASTVVDESSAWKLLEDIETGGNFLAEEHTVRHCRNIFMPKVFQHDDRDNYETKNRRDAIDSALETYHEILQRPLRDSWVDADQIREIKQIVRAADADILAD